MKDKLAIIVPFRDRQKHLDIFVPHIHEFLKDKGIEYDIFIAEQADDRPFNYGKLCNAAVKEVGEEYTYFAFHDIDMLPISDECDYGYPDAPTHLATNVEAHDNKLPYPQYFGGVVIISRDDFEKANGYSNEYWGYGFEDIDLLYRLQRSGAYLEKYYDSNQTYKRYDDNDILPYRIENVQITDKINEHRLDYVRFNSNTKIKGKINSFTKNVINDSHSVSLWFRDFEKSINKKNIFTFEGLDTGIFLDKGKFIIYQVWDINQKMYEVATEYKKNQWNHIIFQLDIHNRKLNIILNGECNSCSISTDFKIHPYYDHIKVSDDETIDISSILMFDKVIDKKTINNLYHHGHENFQLSQIQEHLPTNHYTFRQIYSDNIILDSGNYLNHLQITQKPEFLQEKIITTDNIFLPIRFDGKYKSLTHRNDKDIINRYYEYNPDVEENADIFFHEVITGDVDYTKIGLNSLKYKLMDIKNMETYKLIRIVT